MIGSDARSVVGPAGNRLRSFEGKGRGGCDPTQQAHHAVDSCATPVAAVAIDYTGPDGHADNALVQQARLRVDARKWLMPKKYGDKVTQEITTDPDAPPLTRIELVAVYPSRRLEDLPALDSDDEAGVTQLKVLSSR